MTLSTYDLFTEQEALLYHSVIGLIKEINQIADDKAEENKQRKKLLILQKKEVQKELSLLIALSANTVRSVRLSSVINSAHFKDENGEVHLPDYVDWYDLKMSRRIAEFESEESRAMGLKHLDITFDKIIIKWKSLDMLLQLVMNGFTMPVIEDGIVKVKHYHVMTASAGQLRTDKIQCVSDEIWEKIKDVIECGMTWDVINAHGGINVNKLMAYTALPCSATDQWDFDINKCIVVKDFEAPVTGRMRYISPDYTFDDGIHTVKINHCDGCGMMLPKVSKLNFMIRAPWLKGLLGVFDFILFCKVHNVLPKIKDVWGKEHDLIAEDIQIIFTESQLKLWKYYDDWEHYKRCFIECGCHLCRTNYEEEYIADTTMCYQMLQTLTDFTDEEIEQFTQKEHNRIDNISTSKEAMLRTLGADVNSMNPYNASLALYDALLRDGFTRNTLKDIKKRMTLDAKSGVIKCKNKRLFVLPDLYAACEFWFLGIEEPNGLLADGLIYAKPLLMYDKLDVLRSPHLYLLHSVRIMNRSDEIKKWFITNAIYTSVKDLISRILQFDCDGDQLNCVALKLIVDIAERNIKLFDIVPLFYDANKAPAAPLSRKEMFNGLKRAHDFSGIGEVSNSLTKVWNRELPDMDVAAWLTKFNNEVIDAAKTGKINGYDDKPEIKKRINKAMGGKGGRMPFFFQYSKNGRTDLHIKQSDRRSYANINNSTMNRICKCFDDIKRLDFSSANVLPFNWRMLLTSDCDVVFNDAILKFCYIDDQGTSYLVDAYQNKNNYINLLLNNYNVVALQIKFLLEEEYGSLEVVYPSIVKYLFCDKDLLKCSHKQMFWRVFGSIAVENLKYNIEHCITCLECGMRLPEWSSYHNCKKLHDGECRCSDCNNWFIKMSNRQMRCPECALKHNAMMNVLRSKKKKARDKTTCTFHVSDSTSSQSLLNQTLSKEDLGLLTSCAQIKERQMLVASLKS